MNPLEIRQLGTTSLKVTALGLGGATLGDIQAAIPESQADATVEAAFESGVTYFDTAPWYGIGKSEHRMGLEGRAATSRHQGAHGRGARDPA